MDDVQKGIAFFGGVDTSTRAFWGVLSIPDRNGTVEFGRLAKSILKGAS
jgi:hypothetical protein